MSCKEIDGNGNVTVWTFTVLFTDKHAYGGGSLSKCFTDYTDAWNWARQEGEDWEDCDSENLWTIITDNEWVQDDEEHLSKYFEEHESKREFFNKDEWHKVYEFLEEQGCLVRYTCLFGYENGHDEWAKFQTNDREEAIKFCKDYTNHTNVEKKGYIYACDNLAFDLNEDTVVDGSWTVCEKSK